MDVSKLSPAPWRVERRHSNDCEIVPRIHCPKDDTRECGWVADLVGAPYLGYESTLVNAEFIALARNFADVCERRGWSVRMIPLKKKWVVVSQLDNTLTGSFDTWAEAWQGAVMFDKKMREDVNLKE